MDTFAPFRNTMNMMMDAEIYRQGRQRQNMLDRQAMEQQQFRNALASSEMDVRKQELLQKLAEEKRKNAGNVALYANRILSAPGGEQQRAYEVALREGLLGDQPPAFEDLAGYAGLAEKKAPEYQIIDGQYVPKSPGGRAVPIPGFTRTQEQTSLERQLIAAGYKPGTPEFQQAMRSAVMKPETTINLEKAPSGYRWKEDETLEPIPGGPATKVTAEQAAKEQLLEGGLNNVQEFKQMLYKPNGEIDYGLITQMAARVPFSDGRLAYTLIYDAIEAKLRAESGAAVPEPEVTRMARRFVPSPFDNPETIRTKMEKLEQFLGGALEKTARGRTEGNPSEKPGKIKFIGWE